MINLNPEKEQQIRAGVRGQNLMKLYNANVERIEGGFVEIAIPRQEALVRDSGIFYGGVLSALADTAAYFAAATLHAADACFLTVELKINYLSPALGEKIIGTGEVIKNGKTLIICKSDIFALTNKGRQLVATSLVTLISKSKK